MAVYEETSASHIIFEGYLKKQSMYLKKFRTRWIVLKQDGKLYCYKSHSKKNTPTEIIDIKLYTSLSRDDHDTFSLISDEWKIQNRTFQSIYNPNCIKWVTHINIVIKHSKMFSNRNPRNSKQQCLKFDDLKTYLDDTSMSSQRHLLIIGFISSL